MELNVESDAIIQEFTDELHEELSLIVKRKSKLNRILKDDKD